MLEILRALLEKDESITIGDDVIGRAVGRYERNRGIPVGGAFADAY